MLLQAIKAGETGGADYPLAAEELAAMLNGIQVYQPPARH